MRIGVFSDVHSNWEALEACLARFAKEKVQAYIFCGDIIGYGPDPEKCVQKVLSLPLLACVMGNHDAVFLHPEIEAFFNYDAQVSLEENKKQLKEKDIRRLSALPARVQKPNFTVVHGTPANPIQEYFTSTNQFHSNYELWEGQFCFVGHSHMPFCMGGNEVAASLLLNKKEETLCRLKDELRYVINPGAVGKPRDKNPHASFGVWDTDGATFRFIRQEYDIKKTLAKMERLKYPSLLMDSLSVGL